jgi:hypothetical protein
MDAVIIGANQKPPERTKSKSDIGMRHVMPSKRGCPLYPSKRTLIDRVERSALGQKRTLMHCGLVRGTGGLRIKIVVRSAAAGTGGGFGQRVPTY